MCDFILNGRLKVALVCLVFVSSQVMAQTQVVSDSQVPVIQITGGVVDGSVLEHKENQISLSAEEIINLPGSGDDPLNALDSLPGIIQAGDGVYLRGSSTTDNRILVDRLSVPYLYHFGNTLSLISKDILAGYDVYPAGFGALYGNRLGGIIDIKLRDPVHDGASHQRLHLGTYDASYFVEDSLSEKDSAYFSLRRSHLDLLLSGSSAEDVDFIQFPRFVDMLARWRHQLDNGEINTTLIASTDELLFDLGEGAVDADKSAIGRLQAKQSFYTLGSQYSSQISDNLSHQTTLKFINSKNGVKVGRQQAGDPNPGEPYNFNVDISETAITPILYWRPDYDDEIQFALESIQGRARVTGFFSAPQDERNGPGDTLTNSEKFQLDENLDYSENALALSYIRQWSERFDTTLGVRAESFQL